MERSRKLLKFYSVAVLILAAYTLARLAIELWLGEINRATIPDGSPENVLLIAKIIIMSIAGLLLLPQVYIGIKGLKEAKHPTGARAHIFWGFILFVFTLLMVYEPAITLVKAGYSYDTVSSILNILIEAFIIFDYTRNAKAVADGR